MKDGVASPWSMEITELSQHFAKERGGSSAGVFFPLTKFLTCDLCGARRFWGVATNTEIKWHRRIKLQNATVHSCCTSRNQPICRLKQPRLHRKKRRRSDRSCGLAPRGVEYSVPHTMSFQSQEKMDASVVLPSPKNCPKLQERMNYNSLTHHKTCR